jgi:hypothetical protein
MIGFYGKGLFFSRGLFNVPHVAHAYLINGTFLQHFTPSYVDPTIDPDVKICQSIRDAVCVEK